MQALAYLAASGNLPALIIPPAHLTRNWLEETLRFLRVDGPGAPGACGPWAETLRAAPGRCVHSSLSAAAGLEGDPAPAGLPDADFRRGAGTAPQRHGEILRGQPGGGEMRACDWPVRHAHLQPGRGNLERGQYFGLSFSGRLGELFPGVVLGLWQRHCGQAGAPGRVPAPGRG